MKIEFTKNDLCKIKQALCNDLDDDNKVKYLNLISKIIRKTDEGEIKMPCIKDGEVFCERCEQILLSKSARVKKGQPMKEDKANPFFELLFMPDDE
jgi:hypothetical protein